MRVPSQVRPALAFLPPTARPWLLSIAPLLARLHLALLGVRRIELVGGESLVRLFQEVEEGRGRFLVAFRHSTTSDPTVMFNLLAGVASREARRLGVRLRRAPRGIFAYDRAMLEWAGRWLAWLFPRAGMVSVFPGKLDSESIAVLRRTIVEADYPVALAPEGQVTFHDRRVAELEPGTATLALWAVEDLRRKGGQAELKVLPVSLHYQYREAHWRGVDRLLARVERACGLPRESADGPGRYGRTMRILDRLLAIAEEWYAGSYRIAPAGGDLQRRLEAVTDAALGVAERMLAQPPRQPGAPRGARDRQADWLRRITAGRYLGYNRIYRQDIADPARLPPLERSLAERAAAEGWLALRHVELAGILAFMRADYLAPDSSVDRYVEFVSNIGDFAGRLDGGDISGRVDFRGREVRVIVHEPLSAGRFAAGDGSSRRQAAARLTEAIRERFQEAAREE